jgi:cytochrome c551/c552
MKKTIILPAVATCAFLIHGTVIAADSEGPVPTHGTAEIYQLMKDRGYHCLECHDVDRRVVGPSWRAVAANRLGHKWAHQLIVYKISTGSVGEYGTAEMPHNEVKEEDLDIIADWILSLSGSTPEVAVKSMTPRP